MSRFELIYHPGLPGRGEFIRLYFETTGTEYSDTAIENPTLMTKYLSSSGEWPSTDPNPASFAPPILRDLQHNLVISQTSNILLYLASQLPPIPNFKSTNIDPKAEKESASSTDLSLTSTRLSHVALHANQIMLTIMDFVNEVHDTHHPISVIDYYENQKESALLRTRAFKATRIKKYFTHFESTIRNADSRFLLRDSQPTYADLALFQIIDGMRFAFPKTMKEVEREYPAIMRLYNTIKALPSIDQYLKSNRRQPYKYGIFRYYKELDEA